jgi:hypothetical protein
MARKSSGVAGVATTATLNQDVFVGGTEYLTVIGVVGSVANAAGAAGDVSVQVFPYLDDLQSDLISPTNGTLESLTALPLTAVDTVAAVLAGSRAQILSRYRVTGIRRVQIQVKNNNVATKPVEIDFNTG